MSSFDALFNLLKDGASHPLQEIQRLECFQHLRADKLLMVLREVSTYAFFTLEIDLSEESKDTPPICLQCGVKGVKVITSPANLYLEPEDRFEAAANYGVGILRSRWTGEYYCPKCRRGLGMGKPFIVKATAPFLRFLQAIKKVEAEC